MHPGVYIVLGVFILIVVLGIIWQRKIDASKENIYKDFALKYNLEIHTDDLRNNLIHIIGKIDGYHFELKEQAVGASRDSNVWTYIKFASTSIDFDFQISCENLLMKAFESITGYTDVIIQNKELDEKFVFHSNDSKRMERFLDTLDQMKLLDLYDDFHGMLENKTDNAIFQYIHQGRINYNYQLESLEKILDFMRHLLKKRQS